jgi:hypothetical protein
MESDEHFFGEEGQAVIVTFALVIDWGSGEHVCRCMQFAWYVLDYVKPAAGLCAQLMD